MRLGSTLAALAFLLAAAPSEALAQTTMEVCSTNGDSLAVRSQPSMHGRRTATVPAGERVEVVSVSNNGGWVRVALTRGRFGWMSRMYLCELGATESVGQMRNPVPGSCRTSNHGNRRDPFTGATSFHDGTDVAAPNGTPMFASIGGTVVHAGRLRGYGYAVAIRQEHEDGSVTMQVYGHMCCGRRTRYAASSITVAEGDVVEAGAPIGQLGTTGRSTGPHLHLNMRRVPANAPRTYLDPTHDHFFSARYTVNPEDHLHIRSCGTPNAPMGGHAHDANCDHSAAAFLTP